jgi:aryl-alcohol dehydrogenase-like predicted oxidoreductase
MQRRSAGRTGLFLSELGFGCSSFWAKPSFPEADALAVVEGALAQGITFFDTGASYSAGNAERRLGLIVRAHQSIPGLVLASKVGTHVHSSGRHYKDWSRDAVRDSVQRSLDRLHVDRLDFLHLHGPQIEDFTPDLLETLAGLRREGIVRFVGVNSFDADVIRHALTFAIFDSFMIEYNVLKKRNAVLIEEIAAANRAVLIGTPIAQALFMRRLFRPTGLKAGWELLRALKNHRRELRTAFRYRFLERVPEMTGAQIALAFVLQQKNISTAVFNTTSPLHLAQNIAACVIELPNHITKCIQQLPDA